jgi:hypothetical protein
LARIALKTSTPNIVIILNLIQNIIKLHPKSLILLIRKKKTKLNTREDLKASSKYIGSKVDIEVPEHDTADEDIKIETEQPKYDQFLESEEDPYKTFAEYSCLWELYSLKQHFCFKIRSLVTKFESNFLKSKEGTIDEISGIEEEDLHYDITSANFYLPANSNTERIYKGLSQIIK